MTSVVVTWQSTRFNTTRPKPYFINPECYGEDVARWLITRLKQSGVESDAEPGQEDFGWYFVFRLGGRRYCFLISYRIDGPQSGTWIGEIEAWGGVFERLRNRKKIDVEASLVIHEALSSAIDISDVRWHQRRDFDRGDENGYADPTNLSRALGAG